VCLLRSILISIIEQAHGATPTSDIDIGASQSRLLNEVSGSLQIGPFYVLSERRLRFIYFLIQRDRLWRLEYGGITTWYTLLFFH
jgi:hypothetical protein